MNSSPTTFRGEPANRMEVDWNDSAELHRQDEESGVLHRFKTIRRGSLAELVDFVMNLPEADQAEYSIQKAGDHRLEIGEIRALHDRTDFPGGNAG